MEVRNVLNIDGIIYTGNHGLERWINGHSKFSKDVPGYSRVVKATIKELTPLLSIKGISIEDKRVTGTIHYRLYPEPHSAKRNILAAVKGSSHARSLQIIQERMTIDLLPPIEVNKGTAT